LGFEAMKKIILGTTFLLVGMCLGALLFGAEPEVTLALGAISVLAATAWVAWPRDPQSDGGKSRIGEWWQTVKAVFWGL
jgi:hypothetical protein